MADNRPQLILLCEQTVEAWHRHRMSGADLQYSPDYGATWSEAERPLFSVGYHYRVKPEPWLRPWTPQEAMGKWVRGIKGTTQYQIIKVNVPERWVQVGDSTKNMDTLLKEYLDVTNGTEKPCGVQVS